jgi:hypothetical protein
MYFWVISRSCFIVISSDWLSQLNSEKGFPLSHMTLQSLKMKTLLVTILIYVVGKYNHHENPDCLVIFQL